MLRKKISVFCLCAMLLTTSVPFASKTFAASPNSNKSVCVQTNSLSKSDEVSVKQAIDEAICLEEDVMKTGKAKDYSNIVKNPKLLDLLNKQSKFYVQWHKKTTLKIDEYKSKIAINNITKTKDSTYILDVSHDLSFKYKGANFTSKILGEIFKVEVEVKDGKCYINKMLYVKASDKSNNEASKTKTMSSSNTSIYEDFSDYDEFINSNLNDINNKLNNVDACYEEFRESLPKVDNSSSNKNMLGASYSGYNASAAVAYAQRYGEYPNPQYENFNNRGGDCTNFVSQCALAGGIPGSRYWYAYSNSWIRVTEFFTYMTDNGYGSSISGAYPTGTNGARAGDVVQFYSPSKRNWSHSVILSGTVNGGHWVYCGHSDNHTDVSLEQGYFKNGYTNVRTIKFWH